MRTLYSQEYHMVNQPPKPNIWKLSNTYQWVVINKVNIWCTIAALMIAFIFSCSYPYSTDKTTNNKKLLTNINHIQSKVSSIHKAIEEQTRLNQNSQTNLVDYERVDEKIRIALKTYDADKIGMIDYALESSGAHIHVLSDTVPFNRLWSALLWNSLGLGAHNGPEIILLPGNQPGDCFAFAGNVGSFRIALASPIRITAITIEHVPIETTKDIRSAPKEFYVFGRSVENGQVLHKLGEFQYDIHGFNSIQTFQVSPRSETFAVVDLYIKSNYGHPSYTCVYRFRVHGIENN